jgi:predicted transcriptional regulator
MILPSEIVPQVFSLIEKYDRNLTDIFYTASLNFHLFNEYKGLNISEVAAEGAKRNLNMD